MIYANTSELHRAQSPELLIRAYNERFSGRLTISGQGRELGLRFCWGKLYASSSADFRDHVTSELAHELPQEQINLAQQHAEQHHMDPLTAVEVLGLLPAELVAKIRLAGLRNLVTSFSLGPGRIRFQFSESPPPITSDGAPSLSESLLLLIESLEHSRHLSWCRERIADALNGPLLLTEDGRGLKFLARPDLQTVVTRLQEKRETLASLRQLKLLPDDSLSALVYTLRATGLSSPTLRGERRQSSRPPPGALRTRARNSLRPTNPAPSRSGIREIQLPPTQGSAGDESPQRLTPSSPPVVARYISAPAPSDIDVHELESRVLAAWMRANEDEQWCGKALRLAEAASRRVPGNPQVLFYYGSLLALSGQPGQAQAALRRVLQLDPEHSEAARELARLERNEREEGQSSTLLNRWVSRRGSH